MLVVKLRQRMVIVAGRTLDALPSVARSLGDSFCQVVVLGIFFLLFPPIFTFSTFDENPLNSLGISWATGLAYLREAASLSAGGQRAGRVRVEAQDLISVVRKEPLGFLGHVLPV